MSFGAHRIPYSVGIRDTNPGSKSGGIVNLTSLSSGVEARVIGSIRPLHPTSSGRE